MVEFIFVTIGCIVIILGLLEIRKEALLNQRIINVTRRSQELQIGLNEWRDIVYKLACEKGFHSIHAQPDLATFCANLHGEVSELWEAYRAGQLNKPCDKSEKMKEHDIGPLSCAEEELADIVIRALDVSGALNIDISRAVKLKNDYNQTRAFRHGNKLA